jgi:RNA ligase (TIGR02306 family)
MTRRQPQLQERLELSDIIVEATTIESIRRHPNADRLDIVRIMGTQCVVPKDKLLMGDRVFWIPPNMLLHPQTVELLGVENYLKRGSYPGIPLPTNCRVAATRLRGEVSYGIVVPFLEVASGSSGPTFTPGKDYSHLFRAVKYEPPIDDRVRLGGHRAEDHPSFHKYTDIQNFYKYPDVLEDGEGVRITEKIHGTNSRYGVVKASGHNGDFKFVAGSHNLNLKPEDDKGNVPLIWQLFDTRVMQLLNDVCDETNEVVLYGEVFGRGIQDLDYGQRDQTFRAFDMTINGFYVDFPVLEYYCEKHGVLKVPVLYLGPFSRDILEQHTCGPTTFDGVKSKFKGREGVVVTPLHERWHDSLHRVILKSVSADYLDRKGAIDQ